VEYLLWGMALDSETETGLRYIEMEDFAREEYGKRLGPSFTVHRTRDKDPACRFDFGIRWAVGGAIVGIGEIRTRNFSRQQWNRYERKLLVTADKIDAAGAWAKRLAVPCVMLVFMHKEGIILHRRIFDPDGVSCVEYKDRVGPTRATCNGGTAVRNNRYLDMSLANELAVVVPQFMPET
jgi:hypothetical protein